MLLFQLKLYRFSLICHVKSLRCFLLVIIEVFKVERNVSIIFIPVTIRIQNEKSVLAVLLSEHKDNIRRQYQPDPEASSESGPAAPDSQRVKGTLASNCRLVTYSFSLS